MSFGNRASFASLKDAYGISEFTREPEEINYRIEDPKKEAVQVNTPIPLQIKQQPVIETFNEVVSCDTVKSHCSSCDCMRSLYGPAGTWLNEMLNFGLILILIYILMYRPNI